MTTGQLALVWVHAQGNDVFPIPGTKSSHRIEENARATQIVLSEADLREIEGVVPEASGDRYASMESVWKARA